ncbi:MAG: penicillin-binding transpeptidase domain-containing protein, partial [Actinomycetota bacterium]
GCSLLGGDDGPDPAPAAAAFAAAWAGSDPAAMASLTVDGGREVELAIRQFNGTLDIASTETVVGEIAEDGDRAVAPLAVTHQLTGLGEWGYETEVPLVRTDEDWAVDWSTAVLHPALTDGRRVARDRQLGNRAPILARAGQRLAVGEGETRSASTAAITVGQVGVADRATAAELGPSYAAGDPVGISGLEQAYETRLTGTPSGAVQLVEPTGEVVESLATFTGEPAEPLQTTIDLAVQAAADDAVSGSALPVALVVIDTETGAIRAVANNPTGFDRAFLGEYPPGSTFKVVTAAAMLIDGREPSDRLPCPFETRPGDARPFTNAFGKDGGIVTFTQAFAESCNTTFVDEGFRLGGETLQETAAMFGFDSAFDPGIPAVVGKYPLPESDTELAASAIGQGRVTASPLHMASVAAAARSGTWRAPYLVDPTPELDQELPDGVAEDLTEFMRAVVLDEDGTATNVAVDGYDVGGKTGTAEFGPEEPPQTHAWFIGFVDDLAFAVVVEAGGVGGAVAGPIARTFIENLPPASAGPPAAESEGASPDSTAVPSPPS